MCSLACSGGGTYGTTLSVVSSTPQNDISDSGDVTDFLMLGASEDAEPQQEAEQRNACMS